jgi:hypothetical protein
MTASEQPIIYLQPHLSSEPTLSMNSGAMEEGLNNNNSPPPSSNAAATAASTPHWIKRHALTLTFAFLVLCGAVFSAVVFRPGGPGNPKTMESNLASITRGTDITPSDGDGEFDVRPDTDVPTDAPTSEEEDDDGPEEEEIDTPETVVPTPSPTLDVTSVSPTPAPTLNVTSVSPTPSPTLNVTSVSPTPSPTLNVTSVAPTPTPTVNATVNATLVPTVEPTKTFKPTLLSPTPPPVNLTAYPTSAVPTVLVTDSTTETVNTEATGAPTLPDRND